jgi:hypothetical protein
LRSSSLDIGPGLVDELCEASSSFGCAKDFIGIGSSILVLEKVAVSRVYWAFKEEVVACLQSVFIAGAWWVFAYLEVGSVLANECVASQALH